ncbi:TrbC/VirB2 family protein [Rhizobium tubonense]|uniref:VIRB2 type IV secretion n=1 Tax=Rhizobium tubonense TaxID=484088 RepID=A0A2W4D0F2_9HYPH|nr:TrbC/VirB2 family protein [Rhizobium tubonense]PZM15765.1 VIRB2 type IV secretion [Rhizobium tubonense]
MPITTSSRQKSLLKAAMIAGAIVASQIVASDIAMAQATNQAFAPLQTVVQAVVDFITGPFGRLVAIIAVIGLGFLAFAGRLSWFTAGAVVLGIGLVFGAPAIVDQLMSTVGSNK